MAYLRDRRAFGNIGTRKFRGARFGDPLSPRFEGLLDLYAGAAAAYSLRALSSGWVAGDVVRVRNDSNEYQSFTAGQVLNGSLEAFCGAGDGVIYNLFDQSGNGLDALQTQRASSPKIVSGGVLVDGGIDFNGVNDFLLTSLASSDYTSFAVARYKGTGGSTLFGGGSGADRCNINSSSGSGASGFFDGSTAVTAGGDSTKVYVNTIRFSGTESEHRAGYQDEPLSITGAATSGTTSLVDMRIGGEKTGVTTYGNSVIDTLVFYAGDKTADRDGIVRLLIANSQLFITALGSDFGLTTATSWDTDYTYTSVGASLIISTDATSLTAGCTSSYATGNESLAKIGYRINGGAWSNFGPVAVPGDGSASIAMPAGTNTIEFINGSQGKPASDVLGTFLTTVDPVGSTFMNITSGANLSNQCVVYGDSITAGGNSTNRPYEGYPIVLRELIANPVTIEAWGWRALFDDCSSAGAIDTFVAKIAAVSPTVVWLAIGTNDYSLDKQNAANFETMYADMLADLVVALPSAKIFCASPIHRTDESANAFGDTTGDYRTAISNAVTTIADADVIYVDTSAWLVDGDLDDGVHPTTAGHAIMASKIKAIIDGPHAANPDVLLYEKGSVLSDYTIVGDTVTLSDGLFTVSASPAATTYAKQVVTTGETGDILYSAFVTSDGTSEAGLTLINDAEAYKGGSFLFRTADPSGSWRRGTDAAQTVPVTGLDPTDGAFLLIKYSPLNGTATFGMISDNAGESRLSTYADTTEADAMGGLRVGMTGNYSGSATFEHVKMSKNWILCIGDSITAGRNGNYAEPAYDPAESLINNVSVDIEYSYPEQLGNLRNGPSQALNLGDSADTLADINSKMSDYLSFMPSVDPVVVLFAGTNDINAGASLATLQTRWNTARASIEAAGGTMVGVELLPRNSFSAARNVVLNDFNAWLATDSAANGYSLVLAHDAFESAPDVMNTDLAPDGTHPNIVGHKLLATLISGKL